MTALLRRLRERKLVQWALAYLAGAWLVLQVLHLLASTYGWPPSVMRAVPVLLTAGFLCAVVLAWYHGERGHQRIGRPELLILAAIAVATGAVVSRVAGARPDGNEQALERPGEAVSDWSVAVLPFVNATGDGAQEYVADGITEEILDALAHVPGLRVSARTSSFYFKGRSVPVGEIARELGVANVLEGTLRPRGDGLRISVRLVDARANRQLWTEVVDFERGALPTFHSDVAGAVLHALRLSTGAGNGVAVHSTQRTNPEAHDRYLQGLFHWNRRTPVDLRRAIDLFNEAIRLDASFAKAHAGLALVYAVQHLNAPEIAAGEVLDLAEESARRALALDPTLAEAHSALGNTYHWQWRWDEAQREHERAVALNPNSSPARQWFGEHLVKMGEGAAAEEQLRHAVALDPLSLAAHGNLGLVFLLDRRFSEAIAQLEATVRMDPSFAFPHILLNKAYLQVGRVAEARDAGRRWGELTGLVAPEEMTALAEGTRDPESRVVAAAILERWAQAFHPNWVEIAYHYCRLGDTGRALDALDEAFAARAPMLSQLGVAAYYDSLRGEPRFQRILREMGLE